MFYFLLQRQRNSGVPYFINLDKTVTTLGRLNSLPDNFPQISRQHVRITRTVKNTWFIQDLCSCNGTFVNGTLIGKGPHPLNIGDVIGFGVTGFSEVEGFSCVLCANPHLPVKSVKHEVIDLSDDDDEIGVLQKETLGLDSGNRLDGELSKLKIASAYSLKAIDDDPCSDTVQDITNSIYKESLSEDVQSEEKTTGNHCDPEAKIPKKRVQKQFALIKIEDICDVNSKLNEVIKKDPDCASCENFDESSFNVKKESNDGTACSSLTDVVNNCNLATQDQEIVDVRVNSVTPQCSLESAIVNLEKESLKLSMPDNVNHSCSTLSSVIKSEPAENSEVSVPNFIGNDHAGAQMNLYEVNSLSTTSHEIACSENNRNATSTIHEKNGGKVTVDVLYHEPSCKKSKGEVDAAIKTRVKKEKNDIKSKVVCTDKRPPIPQMPNTSNQKSSKHTESACNVIAPKIAGNNFECTTSKTIDMIPSAILPPKVDGAVKNLMDYSTENKEIFTKKSTLEPLSVSQDGRMCTVSSSPIDNLHFIEKVEGKRQKISGSKISQVSECHNFLGDSAVLRLSRETKLKVDCSNSSRRRSSSTADKIESKDVEILDFSVSSGPIDVSEKALPENCFSDPKLAKSITKGKQSKNPEKIFTKPTKNVLEPSKVCDEEVKKLEGSSPLRKITSLRPIARKSKNQTIEMNTIIGDCIAKTNLKSSLTDSSHINFISESNVFKPTLENSSLEDKLAGSVKASELKPKDTQKSTISSKKRPKSKKNSLIKTIPSKTNTIIIEENIKATSSKIAKVAHVKPLMQARALQSVTTTRPLSTTHSSLQLDEKTGLQHKVCNVGYKFQTKTPIDSAVKILRSEKDNLNNNLLSNVPSTTSLKHDNANSEKKISSKVDSNTMVLKILYWNTSWLGEQTRNSKPPPQISEGAKTLPLSFDSVDSYASTFFSFLLLETWEVVFRKWKQSVGEDFVNDRFHFVTTSNKSWADTMEIQCEAVVNPFISANPFEGFITIVDVKKINHERSSVFGYITKHKVEPVLEENLDEAWRSLPKEWLQNANLWKFSIKVRRKTCFPLGELMTAYLLCNITRSLHLADGLSFLPRSKLANDILKPKEETFTTICCGPQKTIIFRPFNYDQSQLIFSIGNEILQFKETPKIALIHGAPGTGKTVTAIGLVKYLLCSSGLTQRILLLAPSNSAVDFIGKLLIKLSTEAEMPKFRFVRVGPEKIMNSEMLPYSLTNLATAAFEEEKAQFDQKVLDLEDNISHLTYEISTISHRSTFELNRKQSELQAYFAMRRFYQNRERNYFSDEREFKIRVLKQSNVILSTIRASRHPLVEAAFAGIVDPFSCCIVDEATQCTEPDILQPLMFPVHKLVLFGNEQHLPPIVHSQLARNCNFVQSLFERFHLYFLNNCFQSPVCQLIDQCRMHSAIGFFPSQYFYGNLVRFSQILDFSHITCPLLPYIVIDFSASMVDSFKLYIVGIVKQIVLYVPAEYTIGVLVPGQEDCEYFNNIFMGYEIDSSQVEVNTDLGFQGREKEVMVVVCFSINPAQPGYLSCDKRLNIALTRARRSLFVCGIMSWLSHLDVWGALITDARHRGVYASIQSQNDVSFILSKISKNYRGSSWVNIANISMN